MMKMKTMTTTRMKKDHRQPQAPDDLPMLPIDLSDYADVVDDNIPSTKYLSSIHTENISLMKKLNLTFFELFDKINK